jgi:hypothetical protein
MTSPAAAPRVVAAVSREVQRRIRAILPGCELHFVQTEEQLLRALDEARCDMLIVGSHFDESTAVAALERVLARGARFAKLGRPALDALRMALGELRAQHFIDLLQYADDEIGNARVRFMLEQLMLGASSERDFNAAVGLQAFD